MNGVPTGSYQKKIPFATRKFSEEYLFCKNFMDKKIQKLMTNQPSPIVTKENETKTLEKVAFQGVRVRRVTSKKNISTFIEGLQQFGIDLEYACHLISGAFKKKVKVVGPDEICINDDVLHILKYYIPSYWPEVGEVLCEKEITPDS